MLDSPATAAFVQVMRGVGVPDAEIVQRLAEGDDRPDGVGYCEAGQHPEHPDGVLGLPVLHDAGASWSFCERHETLATAQIVDRAFAFGLSRARVFERIREEFDAEAAVELRDQAGSARLPPEQETKPLQAGPLRVSVDADVDWNFVFSYHATTYAALRGLSGDAAEEIRRNGAPGFREHLEALMAWVSDPQPFGRQVVLGPLHAGLYEAACGILIVLTVLKHDSGDDRRLGVRIAPADRLTT